MKHEHKTRAQLIEELQALRLRLAELEGIVVDRGQGGVEQIARDKLRQSELTYRTLLDALPQKVFLKDRNCAYISVSQNMARDLKIEAARVAGKTDYDFFPKQLADKYRADDKRVMESGQAMEIEEEYLQEGQERWVHTDKTAVRDDAGKVVGVFGIFRDITERKRAEDAVRKSEMLYRGLVEHLPQRIFIKDRDSVYVSCNANYARDLGISPEEIVGKDDFAFHPRELAEAYRADDQAVMESGTPKDIEERYQAAGQTRWVHTVKVPYRDEQGRVVGVLGVFEDVTEQKQAQEHIKRLAAIVDSSDDIILGQTVDGVISSWNEGARRVLGYSAEEMIGQPVTALLPPDRIGEERQILERLARGESVQHLEIVGRCKDGRIVDVSLTASPLRDLAGRIVGASVIARDVTERKRAEEALRESEMKHRLLLENLPQKIFVKDRQCVYVSCNDNYARDLKIAPEEIAGKTDYDFHPKELAEKYREDDKRVMAAGETEELDERYIQDGRETWVHTVKTPVRDDKGKVTGILGIFRDITEQKQLEEQFRQAQKLEAVGRLAGGVAHDFNNLLTGIRGFAGFARENAEPGSQAHQDLTEVLALADRAADLTRQLLAFSRRQTLEPVVLNPNSLIADQTKMLTPLLGEDIDIRFMPAPDLGNVRAEPGQIEQVIMNLPVNARDAMPNGGRLTIETANVELGEDYTRNHAGVTAGPYVMIAMSDTGCGMDEKTQQRLFEPFFTTKELGKGTGLGLCTVYGIVQQHGGNIWVYSEPGKGTMFKIYLPRVPEEAEERRPPSEFVTGGSETILLVEDNDAVRDVGRRHLEALGYAVLCASNAREAEEVAAKHRGPINLLLTDMVMPDRNGQELYESMAANQAGLKVLYMSGYTDNAIVHHGVLEEGVAFLQKPFERDSLAAKVRTVLDA
jgi:PAS domain S-box-containing protein